jgi:hypothetical protein
MTHAARRYASTLLASVLLSACSGTPAPDLLGTSGVTHDAGPSADGAAGAPGEADATSAGDDGGAAPDASVGDDAPIGPPQPVDAGGSPPDTGTGVPVDAGAAQDSGTVATDSGPPAVISCGNTTCPLPAEFCCVTFDQSGQQEACASDPGSCTGQGGSAVECTSSSQCPAGQICCGTKPNSNSYSDVSCQAAPCGSGSVEQIQFCDPQGPNDCPPDAPQCQQSTILNGFFICQ